MTTLEPSGMTLRDLPAGVWAVLASLVLALAIVLHAIFPRYDYRVIGEEGHALMIYDRWSGRFQRANYDPAGEPRLTPVVTPF
jgi:hypothetical protein